VDILDAHSGALRLRIFLPQQLMTDIDGLHGSFLATDENGQAAFCRHFIRWQRATRCLDRCSIG